MPTEIRGGQIKDESIEAVDIASGSIRAGELSSQAITGQALISSIDTTNDRLLVYDATDSSLKQVAPDNLGIGGSGSPAGSDTYIQYNNGGSFGGASRLVYDDANGRIGIGTQSPGQILSVYGDVSGDYITTIDNDHSSAGHVLKLSTDGNGSGTRILEMEDGDGDVLFRARADGRFGFGPDGVSSMGAGTFVVGIDNSSHTSDIAISKRLQHLGDSNTYLDFPSNDTVNIVAGGNSVIKYDSSKILLNNSNANVDLQIMADDGNVILHTDAGTNRVGIGTTAPDKDLEINSSSGGSIRLTYNDSNGSASDYSDISVGANGKLTIQTIDSDGTSGGIDLDADGDIVLNVGSSKTLEIQENSTSILKITGDADGDVDFQPQVSNKDIRFGSQGGNQLLTIDSSDDAVKVDRRIGMGYDSITSSGTLNANTPIVMIIAGGSDVTGTLADPSFAGQIKIVIGLNAGVGNSIVSYTNAAGSTTTKTIYNGTGLMLCSFDATGGGALRWVPLGDIS